MKIKLNWGFGVVVAFVGFISFIMFFVIKMSMNDKYSHDLVVEEYYKKEIHFQAELDAQKNAAQLEQNVKVKNTLEGIEIFFPENHRNIEGVVYMYRPSNKKLDIELPILNSESQMLIPKDNLVEGKYILSVNWQTDGKEYLYKKDLQITY
jgi:hypothetical protein